MKIIISHVYSADNKGDAALLGVLVQEVRKEFSGSDITILTMDNVAPDDRFDGVPMHHSFMYFANVWSRYKPLWLLYGVTMMTWTMCYATWWRLTGKSVPLPANWRYLVNLYTAADLVIAVGGGYMRTKQNVGSIYDFMLLLHPLSLAERLGTPTVLYSQSIGPLFRKIEKLLLARTLKRDVTLTIIREDKSMQLMNSLGIRNIARSVDAGFLLDSTPDIKAANSILPPEHRPVIGVTTRAWLKDTEQKIYERALAQALDQAITQYAAYVVFIPQVTSEFHDDDDRLSNHSVFSMMKRQSRALELTANYDYRTIKTLYDGLDFMVGTRFHSVIFALTSGVPAIAIEYEHKTSGIMEDLGLTEWVMPMRGLSSHELFAKIDKLMAESVKYKQHLERTLPAYKLQAHEAIQLTHKAYDSYLAKRRENHERAK